MNRARFVIEAALLGVGALVLVGAQAQQSQPASPPQSGMPMMRMRAHLSHTDEFIRELPFSRDWVECLRKDSFRQ